METLLSVSMTSGPPSQRPRKKTPHYALPAIKNQWEIGADLHALRRLRNWRRAEVAVHSIVAEVQPLNGRLKPLEMRNHPSTYNFTQTMKDYQMRKLI